MGNIFIELSGDDAYAESYFSAYHRMRAIGDPPAAKDAYDTEMDFLVGAILIVSRNVTGSGKSATEEQKTSSFAHEKRTNKNKQEGKQCD